MRMSFYHLAFFVIFFWLGVNCDEFVFNSSKNSLLKSSKSYGKKRLEEEKRKEMEYRFMFTINLEKMGLPRRTLTLVDSFRLLLKNIRKWCNSHPTEVKLGKCFASYFNIKIPGLRRSERSEYYNEKKKGRMYPKKTETIIKNLGNNRKNITSDGDNKRSIFFPDYFEMDLMFPIKEMIRNFEKYRDFIYSNQIIQCTLDYLVMKFWIWVDNAPET